MEGKRNQKLEKNYDFNDLIRNYVWQEMENVESIDEIREVFEKANEDREITNEDVIYFSNAIKYLSENDPSLRESMEIASDYWYETKSLNSELLASLLKTRENEDDYGKFIDKVIEDIEKANFI